jgi:hypothetical protein
MEWVGMNDRRIECTEFRRRREGVYGNGVKNPKPPGRSPRRRPHKMEENFTPPNPSVCYNEPVGNP